MSQTVPFIILQGRRYVRSFEMANRLTVGSSSQNDLCIEDERIDSRWGVLFRRSGKLYAQREGGAAAAINPGDAVDVGPFTLVRADPHTSFARQMEKVRPGQKLDFGKKEPFHRVVLLAGSESRAPFQRSVGAPVGTPVGTAKVERGPDIKPPSGLQRGPAAPWANAGGGGLRRSTAPGRGHFDAEPNMSQAAERVLATFVRNMERGAKDPGELEKTGQSFLDELRLLGYTEIVAVLRQAATGWDDNYLEQFYVTILGRSPILAFRWAAIIAERYAADARGVGEVALPRLKIGLDKLVSSDATDAFRRAREHGGKRVAGGPW